MTIHRMKEGKFQKVQKAGEGKFQKAVICVKLPTLHFYNKWCFDFDLPTVHYNTLCVGHISVVCVLELNGVNNSLESGQERQIFVCH